MGERITSGLRVWTFAAVAAIATIASACAVASMPSPTDSAQIVVAATPTAPTTRPVASPVAGQDGASAKDLWASMIVIGSGTNASAAVADVVRTRAIPPVDQGLLVFRDRIDPTALVTISFVTYPEPKGARMLFNGFFAERASMLSAERRSLPLGTEAHAVDAAWPPFHVVYAWQDRHFVLAEASPSVGAPQRAELLRIAAANMLGAALTPMPPPLAVRATVTSP